MSNYSRLLLPPKKSFFLFGPRGTGKSTWLKEHFEDAQLHIDLLKTTQYLKYKRDPAILSREVQALKPGSWVIIDEVQRVPELLNEVHSSLFEFKGSVSFALTGSSARKLKKAEANLLAGRALHRKMFPLSALEIGKSFELDQALRFGVLPAVHNAETDADRIELLDAYVETYLKEEIQQEALVRNLDSFFRFLQVASICHGQVMNLSNIARDVGVSRSTVQGYFEILQETLVGWTLPAFRLRAKVKEVAHSKFFGFDNGVYRALRGEHRNMPSALELGTLFEAYFLGEVRCLNSVLGLGGEMAYWRTESGNEVDLVWHRGSKRIGMEMKYSTQWKPQYNSGLNTLLQEKKIQSAYGIYLGKTVQKFDSIWVFPYLEALKRIRSGEIGF